VKSSGKLNSLPVTAFDDSTLAKCYLHSHTVTCWTKL